MKFGPMNRHERRALARSGKRIDVRIEDGDDSLANAIVVIVSSPDGDATAFLCDAATQEEAVQHAEVIADRLLAVYPGEAGRNLTHPPRAEIVAALSRLDADFCWTTYFAFDGAGNMRMRQERRVRLVLS